MSFFQITKLDGEKGIWIRMYSSWSLPHPGTGLLNKEAISFGSILSGWERVSVLIHGSLGLGSLGLESLAQQYQ